MLRSVYLYCLLSGCLEKVTGEAVPLDDRFTAQATASTGEADDTGAPGHEAVVHQAVKHEEVPPPMPFANSEGDRVTVSGTIVSTMDGAVDFDVSTVDASSEGGLKTEGKVLFAEPGPFELKIPVSTGSLLLSAFQDIEKDGPSNEDPYAEMTITVDSADVVGLELVLVEGARGDAMGGPGHEKKDHFEAPPGYGSDQAGSPDGQPQDTDLFANYEGERVTVSGVLNYDGSGVIDMDLFQEDTSAPGGRLLLGKLKKTAGPFEIQVPSTINSLELDAFVDLTGDGPSGDDPRGIARGIQVSSGAVSGVEIRLVLPEEKAPKVAEDPGGTDLEEEFARTRVKGREIDSKEEGL